ncbi:carbohydrate esterase family 16 protein [Daedalea quercina L-15889]|uniref:Carbohydrate esterase family 16 protein n=1 Tax=Daedalea quercina L-15889 TaxID=1314783 RepID=A0A165TYR6_9APHY|nr:carbohydrate esterase family 16 protein [Daedalea quercina L-15889]
MIVFWLGTARNRFFDEDKTEYSGTQDESEDESSRKSGDATEEAPKISLQVIRSIESELEKRKKQATESVDEEPEVEGLTTVVSMLFDSVHHVYEANARNFLIIDVPPGDRAPSSVDARLAHDLQRRITVWNEGLCTAAENFASKHSDASVFVFSSHKVFSDLLDDPEKFGFDDDDDDEVEANGKIWTSETDVNVSIAVHRLLAEKMADAISFVEAVEN